MILSPMPQMTICHPFYKICTFMCSWVEPFKGLANCIQSLNGLSSPNCPLSPCKSHEETQGPLNALLNMGKNKTKQ